MSRQTVRNICIVLGLALVFALPAAGAAQTYITLIVRALLIAAFLYFGFVMWRENRHQLRWLPERQKAILYAALALLAVLLVSGFFFPGGTFGTLVYLVLIGGLGYLIYRIWQDARRYY